MLVVIESVINPLMKYTSFKGLLNKRLLKKIKKTPRLLFETLVRVSGRRNQDIFITLIILVPNAQLRVLIVDQLYAQKYMFNLANALARLSQRMTTTPRLTVNQELKLSTTHLVLS